MADITFHYLSDEDSSTYNALSKHPPLAPRIVLGQGYTGWCLVCPETAVTSTGGRSRTPPGGLSWHAPYGPFHSATSHNHSFVTPNAWITPR